MKWLNITLRVLSFIGLWIFFASHYGMYYLITGAAENPDRTVIVDFDNFGEFKYEYPLITWGSILTTIAFVYCTYLIIKPHDQDKNNDKGIRRALPQDHQN